MLRIFRVRGTVIWNKEAVVKELVNHFGEKYREEIEETLKLTEGQWRDLGKCGRVEIDGKGWTVIPDEKEAIDIAEQVVMFELEENPEAFNWDWLRDFLYVSEIDKNLIASELAEDVYDRDPKEVLEETGFWEEYEEKAVTEGKEAAKRVLEEAYGRLYEEEVEGIKWEIEEDPVSFFEEMYGISGPELLKKATILLIDFRNASKDAVSIDGWEHFLSPDEIPEITRGGLVIFKEA